MISKTFFKLIKSPNFGKTIENVRNHRDIKLITTQAKVKLVSHNKNLLRKFINHRNKKNIYTYE